MNERWKRTGPKSALHAALAASLIALVGAPACSSNAEPPAPPMAAPHTSEPQPAITPKTAAALPQEAPLPAAEPIIIDVHVDYVCPWCYIGTVRLDRAISASGLAERVIVRRHPFLLDADIPPEGVDLAERLQKKYGRDPKAMFAQVEGVARQTGIPLDFAKQTRTYSTIPAHALMQHLIQTGAPEATQRAVEADLFKLHFVEGKKLSDPQALVALAAPHGIAEAPLAAALANPDLAAAVRKLATEARGIGGVPYFKFPNGETISGAQSEETLVAAIKRAGAQAP